MFGDIEVPLQIVQNGVLCCEAPPHLPGKVAFCITSGNREPCSEVREFEYKMNVCSHCQSHSTGAAKSPEELLLLVRLVQLLLSDSSIQKSDRLDTGFRSNSLKAGDDQWSSLIEALLVGSETPSSTTDWLFQELLKDKLLLWLSSQQKDRHNLTGCLLSKKEQGVIHMIAGLGYVWALNPILSCGVNINFRDINGWTALHWAARFGRFGFFCIYLYIYFFDFSLKISTAVLRIDKYLNCSIMLLLEPMAQRKDKYIIKEGKKIELYVIF